MKFNWRIAVAAVVMVAVLFWAVSSTRSMSYKGGTLKFPVAGGAVTVTNASDSAVPVQLVSVGTRSFAVASPTTGLAGTSAKDTGDGKTQVVAFDLPAGVTTFTVARGTNVNFVSDSPTSLQATVDPMSAGDARSTGILAIVVTIGALFYMSRATEHRWISSLRGTKAVDPLVVPKPTSDAPVGDPNRGRDGRMYSNYGSKD